MATANKGGKRRGKLAKAGKLKVCGATKRDGTPCLQSAGHGTDHPGKGRCRVHSDAVEGGPMTKAGKELAVMATPVQTTPASAIEAVLNLSAGQLTYATMKVAELKEADLFGKDGVNTWVRWQERLMDRVAKFASTASAMGVEERRVAVAEAQTAVVTRLITAVMDEIELTPAQRKQVGPAIRKNLPTIVGQAKEVPT